MRRALLVALVFVTLAAGWLVSPLPRAGLASHAHPARTYDEALALVDRLRAEDSPAIAPECRTELLTHGHRTPHAVLLLHGLTNCPAQFDSLARLAFARGSNVLIPRLPQHGLADRMTGELAHLTAGEMASFTDRAIDAACGLGDSVTVAGLSVGGTMAAWAAANRADVDRVVLIAPMLATARARGDWTPVAAHFLGLIPNVFVWWDDARKQDLLGPKHVYPRFATRAVSSILDMGWFVRDEALHRAPACRSVAMITVGGDLAVDNGVNAEVIEAWRRNGARETEAYEFPASLHLNHDVVDVEQVGGNPSITYPVLSRVIGP